jgi:hypothetical protein
MNSYLGRYGSCREVVATAPVDSCEYIYSLQSHHGIARRALYTLHNKRAGSTILIVGVLKWLVTLSGYNLRRIE